ncbi:GntR family transcriptional regulator [Pseudogemmobacter sonorensis]|uniref:GntR family transcriptional regulator n=1 Tax=Pseudogemmobacter sonorensis TaxID=2989681 RepID=UPI003674BC07
MLSTEFTPIYLRIDAYIRGEIGAGHLREGDRMPSEPELAKRFATTRSTVAKALQKLVFEGVVVRRPGSGSFVAKTNINALIDPAQVSSFEDQLRAQGAEIGYRVLTWTPRSASATETAQLRQDPGMPVIQFDRLRLISGRPIGVEMRVIPASLAQAIPLASLETKSLHMILDEDLGRPVLRVEGRIRAALASAGQAAWLDVEKGAALLVRDYTLLDRDHVPLVCGESLYREEFRIDYIVEQADRGKTAVAGRTEGI